VVGLEVGKVQKEYTVVGFGESDPQKGKISHESPLGLALVGKTLGDTIELNLPSGTISYKVVRIE
jgi:transcription elongation factor GreA